MISIVIPARNVQDTIGGVVAELNESQYVDQVIVVDNESEDSTSLIASNAGAIVVPCDIVGMGSAIKSGFEHVRNSLVLKIDGDIRNPSRDWVDTLFESFDNHADFVSSYYTSDYDEFPVGKLVAKPMLNLLAPDFSGLEMPLAGTYLLRQNKFPVEKFPNDWSFDLALHVYAFQKYGFVEQVYIGELNDRKKRIDDYALMAEELMRYMLQTFTETVLE